jgi:uncharacterized protein YecE (DUF72 family)
VAQAIHIGTSGWSYPSGAGTWNGVFYPPRRPRGFDELHFYAEHFDTVEVNSSFYRVPDPETTRGWLRRTPAEFTFSVKLYQKFTHPDLYIKRNNVSDWEVTAGDADDFRRAVDPIAGAQRLAAVLLQFPASFHAEPDTRAYLEWLLATFADYPLAVELRHRTWSDDASTWQLLSERGAAAVQNDEPRFRDSFDSGFRGSGVPEFRGSGSNSRSGIRLDEPLELENLGTRTPEPRNSGTSEPLTYFRFHGRNYAQWWEHEHSDDRYNYLYSRAELEPFAGAAREAAVRGRKVLMYMNNHFSAKAVANAAILKHALALPVPGEYRREIIERYPELDGIVSASGLPL